ncbi:hypothetical protein DERF_006422 [Dermatophagoides farinae]|uniref:Uncharacterized protein n=1 Tax=Dermatophagoides farinae TaxID=6954 RepID=A0A922I7R4_DERFA|nr:hypothetical protein DERF_006422 [Dermatophagoides farinae]
MKRKEKNRHGSSSYNDDDPCCIIWFCNSGLRHYYYRLYRWYRFCSGNSTSNKREIINDDIYGCHLVTFQHSLIHSLTQLTYTQND